MSIHVASHAESFGRTFNDATEWNIDDAGYLHIIKDSVGIAVFRPASWDSVERIETAAKADEADTKEADGDAGAESKDATPAK